MKKAFFYYNQLLDENMKKLYISIVNSIRAGKNTAVSENTVLDSSSITTVLRAIEYDYPELFYVKFFGDGCFHSTNTSRKSITVTFRYLYDADTIRQKVTDTDRFIKYILSHVPDAAKPSEYLTALWIHDLMAKNIVYDKEACAVGSKVKPQAYTIEGSMDRIAVCAGIAELYMMLCERSDIWCAYIVGDTHKYKTPEKTDGRHAWNLLRLEGEFCYVDVTWDLKDKDSDTVPRKYFGMSTVQSSYTREPDDFKYVKFPLCREPNPANYFVREHSYLCNNRDLENFIDDVLEKKKKNFTIQLAPGGMEHQTLLDNVSAYISGRMQRDLRVTSYSWRTDTAMLVLNYTVKYLFK